MCVRFVSIEKSECLKSVIKLRKPIELPRSAPSFFFSMRAPAKVMYCTSKPLTEGFTMYCTKSFSAKMLNAELMVAYADGVKVSPWDPAWRWSTLLLLLL